MHVHNQISECEYFSLQADCVLTGKLRQNLEVFAFTAHNIEVKLGGIPESHGGRDMFKPMLVVDTAVRQAGSSGHESSLELRIFDRVGGALMDSCTA